MERATGIEPAPPAWELKFSILYFQYLQNRLEKMYVHALHPVHAVSDLRIAGGRLGDGVSEGSLIGASSNVTVRPRRKLHIFALEFRMIRHPTHRASQR